MPRIPPEGEVGSKLRRIVGGGSLPPKLRELERKRYEKLLQTIAAMNESEAQTRANIQKYAFILQQEAGVVEFSPTDIYLGGRYDELRKQEIQRLAQVGLLETRPSKMRGVDTEVYEIPDRFKSGINPPADFEKEFQNYKKSHVSLRNPFKNHDRNIILDWASEPENYFSIDRKRFQRALDGNTGREVNIIQEAVSRLSPKVSDVDQTYRPFAATVDYLVREHKDIHSEWIKEKEPEKHERSARMFDLRQATKQFHQDPYKLVGDPVLYVGIVDASSTASLDNYWKLWKSPQFDHNILIDFNRKSDIEEHKICQHSIGVLGYLDKEGQNLVVRCFALIESDALPPEVIDYQRGRTLLNSQADQSAQIERAIDQLHEDIEVIEGEKRKMPRVLMNRLQQATTIETARQHLLEFQGEHPELAWLAERAMNHLNL